MEGQDDRYAVVGLMQHHIVWSDKPEEWPVYIEVGKSVEEILTNGYLSAQVKASNVKILGVILDADLNADGRYQRIQQLLMYLFPTLPPNMPKEGLIVENLEGKRFGAWLMPDNESVGSLETFLRHLVPVAIVTSPRRISTHGWLGRSRPDNRRDWR